MSEQRHVVGSVTSVTLAAGEVSLTYFEKGREAGSEPERWSVPLLGFGTEVTWVGESDDGVPEYRQEVAPLVLDCGGYAQTVRAYLEDGGWCAPYGHAVYGVEVAR